MGGNRLVCPYTQLLEMSRRLGKYDEADMYVKEDRRQNLKLMKCRSKVCELRDAHFRGQTRNVHQRADRQF